MRSAKTTASAFRAETFLLLCAAATPAHGQEAANAGSDIVVTGQRGVMAVKADRVITDDEVATYGLSSIGELLDEIADERGQGREGTVYLIDGQRVTVLGDIGAYPTEAIGRIEILPKGSAAQLGGSPSQQVVKITLKPQLRSLVGQASIAAATDGGFSAQTGEIGVTAITRPRRINLSLRWRRETALLESERDILQAPGASADIGRFRSLRPAMSNLELRGSVADQLAPNLNGFVTVRLFGGSTRAFLGRDSNGNRLDQQSNRTSGNLDLQLNGELGGWLLAFYATYGESRRSTFTDDVPSAGTLPGGVTQTRARISNAAAEINATRSVLNLPAGPLSLTLRGRISRNSIAVGVGGFTQWSRELGLGAQIPISSAAGGFSALGDLTAGIEWAYTRTSNVGTLTNATYSLQWQPARWLRFSGSIATGRTPPGVELTADPILATPGVRYLDPLRGDTIDVVALTGGNPALRPQRGNTRQLSLELRPSASGPFVFTADYSNTRNEDIIAALPPGNTLLLAAFPERFLRASDGRLIAVDTRPLNFARQSEEQVRYGFELNLPLSNDAESAPNSANSAVGRARKRGGRLRFSFSHAILLNSEVLISPGFAPVDLLSPDAFGFNGGERPRNEFDFGAEYASRGLGVQLNGQHRSQSYINLTGGATPNILRFSPLTTVNVRGFVDGQRLWPAAAWLTGTRFSLQITNIGNSRQNVRDTNGDTPLLYQAGYRDPTGRTVQFEVRKVF